MVKAALRKTPQGKEIVGPALSPLAPIASAFL